MTYAFGLGPLPGKSIAQACDVIAQETGEMMHLPQLPGRGLASGNVVRTASLLPMNVERGPRSWRLSARPQLITRTARDLVERDLDECENQWGQEPTNVKVQLIGPWTLAAALELSDGHRLITDRGALRDLQEAFVFGAQEHLKEVNKRFHTAAILQVDEPMLPQVMEGLRGTTDFDPIRPVHQEEVRKQLRELTQKIDTGVYLNQSGQTPNLDIKETMAILIDLDSIKGTKIKDQLAEALSGDLQVGLGIDREQPRDIERLIDELGLDHEVLTQKIHVFPKLTATTLLQAAHLYKAARNTQKKLEDL